MIQLISVMIFGLFAGYALRRFAWTQKLSVPVSGTIFALLFLMGVSVGGNEALLKNLAALGGQAVLLSMSATLGSVLCGWLVWRWWGGRE